MRHAAVLLLTFVAAACANGAATTATLSPAQCDANWGAVGYADGLDGARISKLEGYKAACARSGVALSEYEEVDWRAGWREGIAGLCATDPTILDEIQLNARDDLCGIDVAAAVAASEREPDPAARAPYEDDYYYEDYNHGPRIYPTFGLGIGIGSRGVTFGSGVGLVFGYP